MARRAPKESGVFMHSVLALAVGCVQCPCLPGPRGGMEGQQEERLLGAGLKAADPCGLGPGGHS